MALPRNLREGTQYLLDWDEIEFVVNYVGRIFDPFLGIFKYHFDCPSKIFYLSPEEVEDYVDYISTEPLDLSPKSCKHQYVNVSFMHVVMACKFCGKDGPRTQDELKIIYGDSGVWP